MADLEKPITTQEDLDALLESDRAEQSKKYDGWMSPDDVAKKYEGWVSPDEAGTKVAALQSQIDSLTSQAEKDSRKYKELDSQLTAEKAKTHSYETRLLREKIAQETGLGWEFSDRLTGEKEEDIRKDAENLKKIIASRKGVPPLANFDDKTVKADSTKAAWNKMLSDFKGE